MVQWGFVACNILNSMWEVLHWNPVMFLFCVCRDNGLVSLLKIWNMVRECDCHWMRDSITCIREMLDTIILTYHSQLTLALLLHYIVSMIIVCPSFFHQNILFFFLNPKKIYFRKQKEPKYWPCDTPWTQPFSVFCCPWTILLTQYKLEKVTGFSSFSRLDIYSYTENIRGI